jgi:hypothetical protein
VRRASDLWICGVAIRSYVFVLDHLMRPARASGFP